MPAVLLASLPLQLVCQLIVPGFNHTDNIAPNSTPSPPENPPPVPDGYVAYPNISAAYKIHDQQTTWKEARRLCLREGAQLALIDSVEKLDSLKQLRLEGVAARTKYTHVGIHSLFDDGDWVSVDNGTSLSSLPWAPTEPNGDYDCVMVNWETNGLSNGGCTFSSSNFVCEIPISPPYSKPEVQGSEITIY